MNKTSVRALPMIWMLAMAILVGCQEDKINNIPPTATLASSGNSQLTYSPTVDGTVWVYDVNNDRIVYSGPLMANQSIVVDPNSHQITIDGRVVSDKTTGMGDQHRIYFQPSGR